MLTKLLISKKLTVESLYPSFKWTLFINSIPFSFLTNLHLKIRIFIFNRTALAAKICYISFHKFPTSYRLPAFKISKCLVNFCDATVIFLITLKHLSNTYLYHIFGEKESLRVAGHDSSWQISKRKGLLKWKTNMMWKSWFFQSFTIQANSHWWNRGLPCFFHYFPASLSRWAELFPAWRFRECQNPLTRVLQLQQLLHLQEQTAAVRLTPCHWGWCAKPQNRF